MATIYTDVITNGWSKLQYRAKVDYSIELLDSVVNITSTCTFQYKGTYARDSWFNTAFCDSNINGKWAPLAQRMVTNPTASKTNWTTAPLKTDEGYAESNPLTITKSITRPPGETTITAIYAYIYTSAESGASDPTVRATKTVEYTIPAKVFTISFNANGGTNAPSSINKTYGQSVTLPTGKPTRIGHTFLGWALSQSAETAQWLAGANFSEAITADTTLYAVWRDDYESPSITALRAYRCGFELTTDTAIDPDKTYYERSGSGTTEDPYVYTEVEEPDVSDLPTYYELIDDDEAGYARIEATWSIDLEVDEGVVNSATMTGTITPEGHPAQAITFQSGYQGTSGNAVALVDGLDVDTQYTVTVTVTDVKGASASTSRTALLLRAFYIFDFGSQGNAIGIGRAAPQSGMEVGYHATFDDIVNLYDELQFNGEQAYPTFIRSSWDISSDQTTLPVAPCFVLDTTAQALYWCDGISTPQLCCLPLSGGTLSGEITMQSPTADRDGTPPSGNATRYIYVTDKDGEQIGLIGTVMRPTSGRVDSILAAYNEVNGTMLQNAIYVRMARDGTRSYQIDDPAAFCDAIDALPLSGGTMTGPLYFKDGTALPDAGNNDFVVAGIHSFSNGGQACYKNLADMKSFLGLGAMAYKASLAASDIPNLDASKITSGILGVARGGTGISNSGHYTGSTYGSNISLTASTWKSTSRSVSVPASTSGIIIGRVVFTGNSSNAGTFRQLISTSEPASDTSADANSLPYDLTPFWSGSGGHYFTSWVITVVNNTGTAAQTRTQYVYSNQAVTVRNYQLYWIPIGHSF